MHKILTGTATKIILAAVVVAAAGGVAYYTLHKNGKPVATSPASSNRQVNTIDYSASKPSDNKANEDRKSKAAASVNTLNTPSTPPNFSATISRANGSGNKITVAANVNGGTSGTCVFNFSRSKNGSPEVSSSSESVQPTNQSAMCPPVTVTMPSGGNWYVSVVVNSNGSKASSEWAANPVNL